MSDEKKPKPLDDLKEGFGLLFRAAKTAVESLPTEKVAAAAEDAAKEAAKQVGKTFETIGNEMDKVWTKATGSEPPKAKAPEPTEPAAGEEKNDEAKSDAAKPDAKAWDDAYAPEPPKGSGGPRIG
jgi:hypothetical protein